MKQRGRWYARLNAPIACHNERWVAARYSVAPTARCIQSAIAMPAASATNDTAAITGTDGQGGWR